MGAKLSTDDVHVRVDGDYDYVDHPSGVRHVSALQQEAVHCQDVDELKHVSRIHCSNPLKSCGTSPADPIARFVIAAAEDMAYNVVREQEVLHSAWPGPGAANPLMVLLGCRTVDDACETLINLAEEVEDILGDEPTLSNARLPARIYGDLHGQFRDLLCFLSDFGFPLATGPCFVFNGDWVDRGAHQVETVALLFAYKVAFPEKVHLVRGNHEFEALNVHMGPNGFKAACSKLGEGGPAVFAAFQAAFNMLPLGCLVEEKVLVVHGGIGDGDWDLEELANAERPIDDDCLVRQPHLYNVLWSDPIPETVENCFGVHDSPRDGHSHLVHNFGKDVTERFCQRNGLEMIVRSHQERVRGCGYEVMHGGRLVRVFSARDYEGHCNDGCIMKARLSRGGKIVLRPKVLRSIYKWTSPGNVVPSAEGVVEAIPSLSYTSCNVCEADLSDGEFDQYPTRSGTEVEVVDMQLYSEGKSEQTRLVSRGRAPSRPS